jgi:hypothetical protein
MAMAYVFLAQSVPAGETRTGHATLSRQWVEAALKILRSDPVYHTASLAAEMQGDLEAAFQYIELARALKPDNQEYQTRSRELRRRREQGRGN